MIKTIDECFSLIQNGANIKQGDVDGGFPITRIETITNDKFSRDRMGYAGITDISKYTSYLLEDGDLLMSHINSVQYLGRTVLYVKQSDETIIHGMNLLRLKARRDVINPAYAKYCFYGHPFRSQIRKITKKSVNQASFAVKDLKQIKLNIPALSEQNEIVMILDKIQQVLAHRIDELSKLDDLIKARFVELFGDPANNEKGFIKAPMGEYMTVLTDFSSNGSYKTLDSGVTMYDEPNYAWMVRTTDLESGDMTAIKYIDEEAYELLAKSKIYGGEIIMNKIGSAGKIYLMPQIDIPASLGRNAFMFRYDERINVKFLYHLLTSEYGQREIQQYVRGAVTKTITKNDVRAVLIIVPPIELQNEFESFVEQVNKSKVKVQKALDETQKLFDSLMQQYFG